MPNLVNYITNSGLSSKSFAKKAGIEIERFTSITNGLEEPTMSEVRKISKVLKVPVELLISNESQFEKVNVLFRQAVKNKKEQQEADKISYTVGNALSLLEDQQYNRLLFDDVPSVENNHKGARLLASFFRKKYCHGDFLRPLLDLPRIVSEDLNVILFTLSLGSNIEGASAIIDSIPFIFISPSFGPRMLFTLAHELAHILSHHNKGNSFAQVDENIDEIGRSKFVEEAFANAFASELLLPEEGVGVTLKSIRNHFGHSGAIGDIDIIYLSRIYGVSFDAAAKRCEDIKLLPSGGAISLSNKIKEEHKSAEKRADELNIRKRPPITFPKVSLTLIDLALEKINSGELSIGKASEILSVPMAELFKQNAKAE